jgi:cardiolipin synthase
MQHLPNLISVCRLATAPVILVLAWHGYSRVVLGVLVASFASDVLDGYLARRYGQTSEFGARLDSLGDFIIYITIPMAWWLLWPDSARHAAPYIIAVIASVTIPPLTAFCKFHAIASYHTRLAKLAALLIGGSTLLIFAGGPTWPFRVATPVSCIAALEEIAITLTLTERRSNVRSLWGVIRQRKSRVDL